MKADTRPHPAAGDTLEELYRRYNRRAGIASDPVRFVHGRDLPDREIAALIASSLAYGRVGHILKSVARVLDLMPSPAAFLTQSSRASIRRAVGGFRHRFTTADDLAGMLCCVKGALARYGSLERCFASGMKPGDETVVPALTAFVEKITGCEGREGFSLLPSPARGSACKRLNLFLRWMVRRDEVDPGGWSLVPASKLVVPLDTHMHRISRELRFTRRKQADLRTALEVTAAFRELVPGDPVRYDFTLTHLGISGEASRLFPGRVHGARPSRGGGRGKR
jgi:uncharacterized protein (TIGR02757 family)